MILKFTAHPEDSEKRLDIFLAGSSGDEISRTSIQKWIKDGHIVLLPERKNCKASQKVIPGQSFEINIPPKKKILLQPVEMNIPVLYEDDDLIVICKPAGIASHGGVDDERPSLVNGLLFHFRTLSSAGGEMRPGIVHRLDKPTSGIMVVAKTDKAHLNLARQFLKREVEKTYYAWLVQTPKNSDGRIDAPIGRHPELRLKMCVSPRGRKAVTHYKIIQTISSKKHRHFSLAEIKIETGRTHQIRVHFQHIGAPIVGDMLYSRSGAEFSKYGLLLFSGKLSFTHPGTGKKMKFELPLPENFILFEKEAPLR